MAIQIFAIAFVLVMLYWALMTVVQSKLRQVVKRIYDEFDGKGEIYYGKTGVFKLRPPHAVAVVCCDTEGIVLEVRCIYQTKTRGQPEYINPVGMEGKPLLELTSDRCTDDEQVSKALANLIKNYKKYCPALRAN
jgi:hypothetical protein